MYFFKLKLVLEEGQTLQILQRAKSKLTMDEEERGLLNDQLKWNITLCCFNLKTQEYREVRDEVFTCTKNTEFDEFDDSDFFEACSVFFVNELQEVRDCSLDLTDE